MAEKHKQAEKDYVKGLKYKEIAEKHGVSINTVKSWKQRHGWTREKGAPPEKSVHTKKIGAPKGNKNSIGNHGGAPVGNANAVSHGLFAKYLPDETREIADQVETLSPLDILWMNIKMQFASIMRAQQIMFVSDRDDMTKEIKKEKVEKEFTPGGEDGDIQENETYSEKEYEIQFAWDKQASFLNSQSRAMGELRSMLKQFAELSTYDDDRKLEAERMQATIDKTKADTERAEVELEKAKQDDSDKPIEIMIRKKGDGDD